MISTSSPRVALATCSRFPNGDPEIEHLGLEVVVWDDPTVDWPSFDLVVLRSTWDYPDKVDEFLDWTRRVPRLLNAPDVVEWNHDKRYLAALHAAGVPTVPTRWGPCEVPDGRWVVKPRVGAGARGITVVDAPTSVDADHCAQPYLDGIDEHGETAIVYIGDDFSHAARKGARLGLHKEEEAVVPCTATTAEHELAEQVLDTIPFDRGELLYARVDLVPGPDGDPVLLELELIEPSLFVDMDAAASDRLLRAISAAL